MFQNQVSQCSRKKGMTKLHDLRDGKVVGSEGILPSGVAILRNPVTMQCICESFF